MGLDCSHNAWHGAYSAFVRWREKLSEVAGLPPLVLMEGFFRSPDSVLSPLYFGILDDIWRDKVNALAAKLPIRWECLKPDPLHELLRHSDCDGEIEAALCRPIADSLERLIPLLPDGDAGGHIGIWRDKTQQFIDGLRRAADADEPLDFH